MSTFLFTYISFSNFSWRAVENKYIIFALKDLARSFLWDDFAFRWRLCIKTWTFGLQKDCLVCTIMTLINVNGHTRPIRNFSPPPGQSDFLYEHEIDFKKTIYENILVLCQNTPKNSPFFYIVTIWVHCTAVLTLFEKRAVANITNNSIISYNSFATPVCCA